MKNKIARAISASTRFAKSSLLDHRPALAYVGGWLGKKNLGDELLFRASQALFPDIQFAHFDGGRISKALYRANPRILGGMLSGGTLIGQSISWLETIKSYNIAKNDLEVFGTGVADPHFWKDGAPLSEWVTILKNCKSLAVRGPISSRLLAEHGLEDVPYCGDPAVVFARKMASRKAETNTIGINIGVTDGRMWGSEEHVCRESSALAKLAKKKGWRVTWFVVWPKDLEITQAAATESDTTEDIRTIYDDHDAFIDQVADLSCFVGMKLHATILATCAHTPSVMLEYRSKCRDYMQSINHDQFAIRTDKFNSNETWEILEEWNNNRNEAALQLGSAVLDLQKKQLKMAASLSKDLREKSK